MGCGLRSSEKTADFLPGKLQDAGGAAVGGSLNRTIDILSHVSNESESQEIVHFRVWHVVRWKSFR